jgi:serine/threonine protein phosphatase PrpC
MSCFLEDIIIKSDKMPILKRSKSTSECESSLKSNNIMKYLAISDTKKSLNVSHFNNPGYTYRKKMMVNKKIMPYTEDRNINFFVDCYHVIGSTDGHGGSPETSILVSGSFPIFFADNLKKCSDIETVLTDTFEDINRLSVEKHSNGGSTLSVCVIDKVLKCAYIANLGDSVVQIYRKVNDSFVSIFRTIDHSADNLIEQSRLTELFGNFVRFEFENGKNCGAIYAKIYNNQIMVVGGFGDFHFPEGFIKKKPDISIINLEKDDIIISSSDGFYESYIPKCNMIGPGRNEQEIINDLNELHLSKDLYNSSLALNLYERQVLKIAEQYGRPDLVDSVKISIDNNTITTIIIE